MAVSPYISSPNILDVPEYVAKNIQLVFGARQILKAGTPIGEAGAVKNDGDAIGVLLFDVHKSLGNTYGAVVISGRVKTDVAASHSGITLTAAAKAAMKNIAFTDDAPAAPLPEATAEDAGKSVVVGEDGGYTLGDPSGGGSVVVYEVIPNDDFSAANIYDGDGNHVTVEEIYRHIKAGETVHADMVVNPSDELTLRCYVDFYADDSITFIAYAPDPTDSKLSLVEAVVYTPENLEYAVASITFFKIEN